jgi:hypothetical protein
MVVECGILQSVNIFRRARRAIHRTRIDPKVFAVVTSNLRSKIVAAAVFPMISCVSFPRQGPSRKSRLGSSFSTNSAFNVRSSRGDIDLFSAGRISLSDGGCASHSGFHNSPIAGHPHPPALPALALVCRFPDRDGCATKNSIGESQKSWFERLFGFRESVDRVKANFAVDERETHAILTSNVNKRSFMPGASRS